MDLIFVLILNICYFWKAYFHEINEINIWYNYIIIKRFKIEGIALYRFINFNSWYNLVYNRIIINFSL